MAIIRKPKATKILAKEQNINALINKGGSVAEKDVMDNERQPGEKPILIRVPAQALKKIDEIVSSRRIKTPRHTWLLEAIFEKLEREV